MHTKSSQEAEPGDRTGVHSTSRFEKDQRKTEASNHAGWPGYRFGAEFGHLSIALTQPLLYKPIQASAWSL